MLVESPITRELKFWLHGRRKRKWSKRFLTRQIADPIPKLKRLEFSCKICSTQKIRHLISLSTGEMLSMYRPLGSSTSSAEGFRNPEDMSCRAEENKPPY